MQRPPRHPSPPPPQQSNAMMILPQPHQPHETQQHQEQRNLLELSDEEFLAQLLQGLSPQRDPIVVPAALPTNPPLRSAGTSLHRALPSWSRTDVLTETRSRGSNAENEEEEIHAMSDGIIAAVHHRIHLMTQVLRRWRTARERSEDQRIRLERTAVCFYDQRIVFSLFRAWQWAYQERQRAVREQQLCDAHRQRWSTLRYFAAWRRYRATQRKIRQRLWQIRLQANFRVLTCQGPTLVSSWTYDRVEPSSSPHPVSSTSSSPPSSLVTTTRFVFPERKRNLRHCPKASYGYWDRWARRGALRVAQFNATSLVVLRHYWAVYFQQWRHWTLERNTTQFLGRVVKAYGPASIRQLLVWYHRWWLLGYVKRRTRIAAHRERALQMSTTRGITQLLSSRWQVWRRYTALRILTRRSALVRKQFAFQTWRQFREQQRNERANEERALAHYRRGVWRLMCKRVETHRQWSLDHAVAAAWCEQRDPHRGTQTALRRWRHQFLIRVRDREDEKEVENVRQAMLAALCMRRLCDAAALHSEPLLLSSSSEEQRQFRKDHSTENTTNHHHHHHHPASATASSSSLHFDPKEWLQRSKSQSRVPIPLQVAAGGATLPTHRPTTTLPPQQNNNHSAAVMTSCSDPFERTVRPQAPGSSYFASTSTPRALQPSDIVPHVPFHPPSSEPPQPVVDLPQLERWVQQYEALKATAVQDRWDLLAVKRELSLRQHHPRSSSSSSPRPTVPPADSLHWNRTHHTNKLSSTPVPPSVSPATTHQGLSPERGETSSLRPTPSALRVDSPSGWDPSVDECVRVLQYPHPGNTKGMKPAPSPSPQSPARSEGLAEMTDESLVTRLTLLRYRQETRLSLRGLIEDAEKRLIRLLQ